MTMARTFSLDARRSLLQDVRDGLRRRPRELDPKYFYDDRGSDLFERITELPEYYLTRAERDLLESEATSLIEAIRPAALVELGAGGASKTRIILDAMHAAQSLEQYVPVDVSSDFLEGTASRLRTEYPEMRIDTAVADFSAALPLPDLATPTLFAFLGSTIGNFETPAAIGILKRVAASMSEGDCFLLGADLRKDIAVIEAAYNDSAGVTADFNLNMLRVLNRELGADFDVSLFRHRAFYNRVENRIEMHLDSMESQSVHIPGIGDLRFKAGESIRTELSYKYDRASIESLFAAAGLGLERWMTGSAGAFALALGRRIRH